ncbi:hypothetical protein QZH41_001905 [Actinostola sp. cb2023]|nr:hypothetical protein QZH41_001905 [Actinostola sp. cb2023]
MPQNQKVAKKLPSIIGTALPAYGRCPLTGGVRLREVSAYGRCPLTGGVRLREVSAYGRCPLTGGVRLREVSAYGRCPLTGGVRLREVSAYGRCPLTGGVRLREVSAYGRCPLTGGVRLREVSAYGRCPLTGGARLREVSALTGGVRLREVSAYGRCPLLREVSAYGRCPLTGGVRLREVSAYGRCPLTGGVRLREVSRYGRCPLTGGVRLREVSAYGRCPLTGGVRLREVSAYGRCPLTGGVRLREVQTFLILILWLYRKFQPLIDNGISTEVVEEMISSTILAYDNMCHVDGLKVASKNLPFQAPLDKAWLSLIKVIDKLHIRNHTDAKWHPIHDLSRYINPQLPNSKLHFKIFTLECAEEEKKATVGMVETSVDRGIQTVIDITKYTRRGTPTLIVSNNAKTFQATDRALRKLYDNQEDLRKLWQTEFLLEVRKEIKKELQASVNDSMAVIRTKLREVEDSQKFIASKYDSILVAIQEVKKDTQSKVNQLNDFDKDLDQVKKSVYEVQVQLDELQQYTRRDSLELCGIPVVPNDDPVKLVIETAKLAGLIFVFPLLGELRLARMIYP